MHSPSLVALLLLVTSILSTPTPGGKDAGRYKTVKEGQCIQNAINKAYPGDIIIVEGTFEQHVTVNKSGITLIGKHAILKPPQKYTANFCSGLAGPGTEAGICVQGTDVVLGDYVPNDHRKFKSASAYIENVVVTGFKVEGFSGENIAVVAGKNVKVTDNKLVDGKQYGFLTVGSKSTLAEGNTVETTAFGPYIAMCMDDQSDAVFRGNDLSGYFIALCTQTNGGLVTKNKVKNCCVGPFIDPGVNGAKIIDNTIKDWNPLCPVEFTAGVFIFGAINTVVEENTIKSFKNQNGTGVGILVLDEAPGTAKASGNVVKRNKLKDNDYDIVNLATATENVLVDNKCDAAKSFPGSCN